LAEWFPPLVLALLLLPINYFSALLFHLLIELFAVAIALVCFVVAWNTYRFSHNRYLMCLGVGYFWVGVLDLAHALSFKDMPFFVSDEGNASLQLSLLGRCLEALLLFSAPFYIHRRFSRSSAFIAVGMGVVFVLFAVAQGWLPPMLIEGEGLQPAKIVSEYIIIFVLASSALGLYLQRNGVEKRVLQLVYLSIALTIAAEVTFTLYAELSSSLLTLGHYFKLFSFWAIYIALINCALREPFRSLARDASTYDAVPDQTVVVDAQGVVRQVNQAVRDATGLSSDQCVGMHCHDLLHPKSLSRDDCLICKATLAHEDVRDVEMYCPESELWYEITLTSICYSKERVGMVQVRRDITSGKQAQAKLAHLNRLYSVLSYTNKAILGASHRDLMFQKVCDIAVNQGGFMMSWIGVVAGLEVQPQHVAGNEDGYMQQLRIRLDDSVFAQGPVGLAAKQGEVCCVNNTELDPSFEPWREAAKERGYAAVAAVPLFNHGVVEAVFTLYSAQEGVFDRQMVALLKSLSDDISAAITHLEQEKKSRSLDAKLNQLSQAVEQSANCIVITDMHGTIEYVNRAFCQLTQYQPEELLGRSGWTLNAGVKDPQLDQKIHAMLLSGREWFGEHISCKKDGSEYWSAETRSPIKDEDGTVTHILSTSMDNSGLHEAQETIKRLAFYDPLTNLPNRRLMVDRLQQAIDGAQRFPDQMVAVMVFDLDNFKNVNDSLGHKYGDMLLEHVANVFTRQVRRDDTVSRLGGDEFTMILRNMKSLERVVTIANNIIRLLAEPINLSGSQVVIGTSIGIALYPNDGDNCDALIRQADMAMYHAKSEGKNNFQFYRNDMNAKAQSRIHLENKLRKAIENEHFVVHYQPQVDVRNGCIIGMEALVRWLDPDEGLISPAVFIPLAEETGMIGRIGEWVMRRSCEETKLLHEAGFPKVKVAVNVSGFQIRHGEKLANIIKGALTDSGLDPAFLSLEITESMLVEDVDYVVKVLASLKSLGITIAIDDFGTGYSSLSYLKRFPIDILKIDQSFIRDILDDDNDKAIVNAIIAIAHNLGLTTLAEGVEYQAQTDYLLEQNCDLAQGFLYCRPQPALDILAMWESGAIRIPRV
jgi:diguanylate cyclase (GGDEF)-like protein/PAS domain S-box-containing protein